MMEERPGYGKRVGKEACEACMGSVEVLVPVVARYMVLRELGAAGVTSAVCVCRWCGQVWEVGGIAPYGELSYKARRRLGGLLAVGYAAAAQEKRGEEPLDESEDPFAGLRGIE